MVDFYKPGDFFPPSQTIEIVVSGLRWRLKAWLRKCWARCGTWELKAQARQGVCCCFAAFYRGRVGASLAPRSGTQVAGGGAVQTAPSEKRVIDRRTGSEEEESDRVTE